MPWGYVLLCDMFLSSRLPSLNTPVWLYYFICELLFRNEFPFLAVPSEACSYRSAATEAWDWTELGEPHFSPESWMRLIVFVFSGCKWNLEQRDLRHHGTSASSSLQQLWRFRIGLWSLPFNQEQVDVLIFPMLCCLEQHIPASGFYHFVFDMWDMSSYFESGLRRIFGDLDGKPAAALPSGRLCIWTSLQSSSHFRWFAVEPLQHINSHSSCSSSSFLTMRSSKCRSGKTKEDSQPAFSIL